MIKPKRNPYGYKNLLVYKKADELMTKTTVLTDNFPRELEKLKDQMDRSARSTKQNIVEGWKRNSTREYYEFLGYSLASNAELEEDCDDIIKRRYAALTEIKGIMGETGKTGEIQIDEVEKLPFYPLDPRLALIIQLKLRCKEINFLLDRLQQSLIEKMKKEGVLSTSDKFQIRQNQDREAGKWFVEMLQEKGFVRLENGRIVKKGETG